MHRSIATCLAAVVGTAAGAGPRLHARKTAPCAEVRFHQGVGRDLVSRPCARPPAGHSLPGGRLRKKVPPRRGDATLRGRALDGLARTRYKTCMRRSRSALLRWGAVIALALLAIATAPHFHDEAEARDDTCVLCHAQGSPPIASCVLENPDPSAAGSAHARAPGHARQAEVEGHGSRAPPA